MATSVYFNREASRGSTYFLEIYYSLEYSKVKILHFNLFQGEGSFPGGSTFLLANKRCGSSYFPVNNYWEYFFPGTTF